MAAKKYKKTHNPLLKDLIPLLVSPKELCLFDELSIEQFCYSWYKGRFPSEKELEYFKEEWGFQAKCIRLLAAVFGRSVKSVDEWFDREKWEFHLPATIRKKYPNRLSEVLLYHQAQSLLVKSPSSKIASNASVVPAPVIPLRQQPTKRLAS